MSDAASGVAIVGMAGRFPGASNVDAFWRNLLDGVDAIETIPADELRAAGVSAEEREDPRYVPRAGRLENIDRFDAAFFGMASRDAELLDPQQRLLLECAWETLENAGYAANGDVARRGGVYAGAGYNSYLVRNIAPRLSQMPQAARYRAMLANDKDFLATRVAHALNFTGPALTIQTGCSSSLVGVCTAALHLLTYQCDIALAGGVSLRIPDAAGYLYEDGGISSPDGVCRSFDADARGTVWGSAVAMVVLKRLEDAERDGDTIVAVISGFALNNDGSNKASYTAPSVDGQAEVVASAIAMADIPPRSVGFVEAHGTATAIGDPIEVAALSRAFGPPDVADDPILIGSLKSNVGHLDTVAGVAGLIKAALAIRDGVVPPTLHFRKPNPLIDFQAAGFTVNSDARAWPAGRERRRAGVSSFGIGGTNAHVMLEAFEEPPTVRDQQHAGTLHVLPLSARTETALAAASARLAEHLVMHPSLSMADVTFTLQSGRAEFAHRRVIACRNAADAVAALRGSEAGHAHAELSPAAQERIRRWLAGQSTDWSAVGSDAGGRRIPLPTYPFERQRYWIEALSPDRASDETSPRSQASSVSPASTSSIIDIVREEVVRVLGPQSALELSDDAALAERGMDSLMAVELRGALSTRLARPVPAAVLSDAATIASVALHLERSAEPPAATLSQTASQAASRSAVPIHPESPYPTMLFIGGAVGGDELYLRDVASALGPSIRSFALLYPGLQPGEQPLSDIGLLADAFAEQVRALPQSGPCAIIGHSVGGVVAFELALRLAQHGTDVTELVLLDAPLVPHANALSSAARIWGAASLTEYLDLARDAGWMTPDIERAVSRRDLAPDAWTQLEQMWTASMAALHGYRPAVEYHGSATFITPARATDGLAQCADLWRANCPALRVIRTSGNHLSMVRAPHASKTARAIRNLFSASDLEAF